MWIDRLHALHQLGLGVGKEEGRGKARQEKENPGQNQQQFLVGGKQADRLLPGQIAVETHGIAPLSRRSRAQ
jgi:hypothetical protein